MDIKHFPKSTAVNSNGGCFYHGVKPQIDLSDIKYGNLSGEDREKENMAKADILLYFAEPETHPSLAPAHLKNKLTADTPATHPEAADETAAKQPAAETQKTRKRSHGTTMDAHEEREGSRTSKRVRVPSKKALEASNAASKSSKRGILRNNTTTTRNHVGRSTDILVHGESPAARAGLYLMSGALQSPTSDREAAEGSNNEAPDDQPRDLAQAPVEPDTTSRPLTPAVVHDAPMKKRKAIRFEDEEEEEEEEEEPTKRTKITPAPRAPTAKEATAKKQAEARQGPPPPGYIRNPRGKFVTIAASEKMKKAWKARQEKGTSGRHGDAPKKETVEKNKAKGVNYAQAANTYQQ